MASKTFFGILFGVPLATALGIEAASFLIFLDLVRKKIKKIQPKARPFFDTYKVLNTLQEKKKGTPKKR